jgi:hypothetical protein
VKLQYKNIYFKSFDVHESANNNKSNNNNDNTVVREGILTFAVENPTGSDTHKSVGIVASTSGPETEIS